MQELPPKDGSTMCYFFCTEHLELNGKMYIEIKKEASTDHDGNSYTLNRNQRQLIPKTSETDMILYSSYVSLLLDSRLVQQSEWIGSMCAHFSELEHPILTTTSSSGSNFDPEIHHYLSVNWS
ncbi:hypothetical protein FEM48_Zijuj07G0042800 [Ziziphus jujuba var. spinosa]|uniref:Uncharacterized protein n=1 Tax=Ziziphus jujuba var. spinosa TaxID=714518 RepID=A0A978V2E2_ZIZJJ|nr:hypothetical protein FEM48_Zijuj07G0042800 [Ziziphus jujuba var. spinosa]